jgi:hypothetical protein
MDPVVLSGDLTVKARRGISNAGARPPGALAKAGFPIPQREGHGFHALGSGADEIL